MAKVSFRTKSGQLVQFTTKSKKKSGGSKKSKGSGGKLKGKALAAARKNIKKAQAALRRKGSSSNRSKGSKGSNKMAGQKTKQGVKVQTRLKKFLIGFGSGAAISTTAGVTRIPELEAAAPVVVALAGGGVEGQLGAAVPRIIRVLLARGGISFNGGGNGGLSLEGA